MPSNKRPFVLFVFCTCDGQRSMFHAEHGRPLKPILSFSSPPQNVTANHRVNDAVFTEDGAQTVAGRFMYGPLDMVTLTGEKVNAEPRSGGGGESP